MGSKLSRGLLVIGLLGASIIGLLEASKLESCAVLREDTGGVGLVLGLQDPSRKKSKQQK